ncbi:MAG TPA: DUF4239 domain-containing protein [Chthoniobacterales bacterium]|nr:DUF4239 domain-containing protein [Chthoniobacterales bacterium]
MSYTLLGLLMIGGLALYALVGVSVSRKILHGKVQEGHNDVCVPIFLNAGVLFAVLLGFMVIAVWEAYDAAKTTAATEAAALVPLYRAAGNLPKNGAEKIRDYTREYVHAVIEDEWPRQTKGEPGSSKARHEIGNLFRAFGDGTIDVQTKKDFPMTCTAVMQHITEVTSDRNKRIIQANESLPPMMWIAIVGGSIIIITLSCVIYMERPVPHQIMASLMAALIGLLLFSCYVLSHPFRGPIAISSEAFEKTITVLDDVDQGN